MTDDLATGADKAETTSGNISAPGEGAATMNTGVAESDYQAARMLRALSRVVDAKAGLTTSTPYVFSPIMTATSAPPPRLPRHIGCHLGARRP